MIGVTGNRILADPDRISFGIAEAIDRIVEAFPGGSMRIVSCLAEGADRLVAHQMQRYPDSQLTAVLPLPQSDYMTDFSTTQSKREFLGLLDRADKLVELPMSRPREQAYETAGRYVLDHCDVLVAIWDGSHAQGRGGTGDVVSEARKRGLPIAWVQAGNRKLGTKEPTTLGEEQGKVNFERFPRRTTPTEGKRGA